MHEPCRPARCLLLVLLLHSALGADTGVWLTELGPGADDGLDGLDAAVVGDTLYFVGEWGAANRAPPHREVAHGRGLPTRSVIQFAGYE